MSGFECSACGTAMEAWNRAWVPTYRVIVGPVRAVNFNFLHYLVVMSDDDAARFRKQAEECRAQTAKTMCWGRFLLILIFPRPDASICRA
jgi:hypothetical protein